MNLSEEEAVRTLKDFMENPDDYFSKKYPHIPLAFYDSVEVAIKKMDEPQLSPNQQAVLEIMQNIQKRWSHFHPSSVIDTLLELESEYYDELTKIEELQVFQVFITWAIEQENLVQ